MVKIFDQSIRVGDGTISSLCFYGAREGQKQMQEWREITSRVTKIETRWIAKLHELSLLWQGARGYFIPNDAAVQCGDASKF